MQKHNKIAVVLFNLGGPDCLKSVQPFLFNLFYDKHILRVANPLRFLLAKIISYTRKSKSQAIYKLVHGSSPILNQTKKQENSLNEELSKLIENFKIFTIMRYWHPLAEEVIPKIKEYSPSEILLLPLYPQFSTTTTLSSVTQFNQLAGKHKLFIPTKTICCYPLNSDFIKGHVQLIQENMDLKNYNNTILLFSAHSIPEKFVVQGDPYQWQVEKSVQEIVKHLKFKPEWKITYQSKIGPLKWLQPDTKAEIIKAGMQKKNMVIVPISFVSEHVETLVELDIEYAKIAKKYKVSYLRIPTLGINEFFIKGLAKMILSRLTKEPSNRGILSQNRLCPLSFVECLCKS